MKIGIVLDSVAIAAGGAHSFFEKLLSDLKALKTKHEFIIFHQTEELCLCENASKNLTFVKIQNLSLFARIYRKLFRTLNHIHPLFELTSPLDKALNKYPADLMIYPPGMPLSEKIPYIVIVWDVGHRIYPYLPEERFNYSYMEQTLSTFLPKAFRIITGNNAGRQQLLRFYRLQPEIIKTMPLPVFDFTPANATEEIQKDFPLPKRPFVFYPAQFWPHKNHITLIKAIQLLKTRDHLDIDVVLTGSDKGNRVNVIRQIAGHGLENQFHLLGLVSPEKMHLLYSKSLALTYLSILGPDNMPPLEAMNLKCPVICAKYEGAEEQLGDAALFFEQFDAEQLASHILSLYQNPEIRENLIRKGTILAEQRNFNYAERLLLVAEEFTPYLSLWK